MPFGAVRVRPRTRLPSCMSPTMWARLILPASDHAQMLPWPEGCSLGRMAQQPLARAPKQLPGVCSDVPLV